MLKTRTQPTAFYKVKAHIYIESNEQVEKLAKIKAKKIYSITSKSYFWDIPHFYFFQKDKWPGPTKRHDKGLVGCLQTYLTKYNLKKKL